MNYSENFTSPSCLALCSRPPAKLDALLKTLHVWKGTKMRCRHEPGARRHQRQIVRTTFFVVHTLQSAFKLLNCGIRHHVMQGWPHNIFHHTLLFENRVYLRRRMRRSEHHKPSQKREKK